MPYSYNLPSEKYEFNNAEQLGTLEFLSTGQLDNFLPQFPHQ